jgi:hypothetical protein
VTRVRIQSGLPRGGIGYAGVPLGVAALIVASKFGPTDALSVAALAVPLCLWLGMGLRLDGDDDEMTDQVIIESRQRYDFLGVKENWISIFRLSTGVILLGLASLVVAIWRWMRVV